MSRPSPLQNISTVVVSTNTAVGQQLANCSKLARMLTLSCVKTSRLMMQSVRQPQKLQTLSSLMVTNTPQPATTNTLTIVGHFSRATPVGDFRVIPILLAKPVSSSCLSKCLQVAYTACVVRVNIRVLV